jgi:PAS domain S-box-containing protein
VEGRPKARTNSAHEQTPTFDPPLQPGQSAGGAPGLARLWARTLGALFARLPDGVYAIDAHEIQPVNQAALALLGYTERRQFPVEPAELARAFELRDAATHAPLSALLTALPSEPSVRELIVRNRESGAERFLRCSLAPVFDGDAALGALVVASDVTERASAQADERRRAEFEQQLIGIVSHDLRNPLQVIRFSAALGLKAAAGDARQSRHFERITSSSGRALRMIDDLLDFTRIRFAGGLTVEATQVDLHALTQRVVEEVVTTRPERKVEVETSGDGRGDWDPDRLHQIVQNLVSNALQHTTEDTPVRVRTRGEEDAVVLEIHNGGPGIPREDQAKLFEPFQRGTRKSSSGRSMGLGLYITAHIVHAHGGSLQVESSDERGTTFRVRLPRTEQAQKERGREA